MAKAANRPVAEIVSPIWHDEKERDDAGEAGQFMRLLGIKSGMTVADISAGSGYYVVRLSPIVGSNSGAFEVYDIANNQLTGAASLGAVGLDWQLGGLAADPPTGSMGMSGSTSQLVQAMAGFGGSSGAAES